MPFEQVRNVLEHVVDLHRELACAYEGLATRASGDPVGRLLAYMADHTRTIQRVLASHEADQAAREVLATWIQYPAVERVQAAIDRVRDASGQPVEEVLRRALEADQAFIDVYGQLAGATGAERVAELFQSLAQLEHNADRAYVRAVVELEEDPV